jgi:hypothetical protein
MTKDLDEDEETDEDEDKDSDEETRSDRVAHSFIINIKLFFIVQPSITKKI